MDLVFRANFSCLRMGFSGGLDLYLVLFLFARDLLILVALGFGGLC